MKKIAFLSLILLVSFTASAFAGKRVVENPMIYLGNGEHRIVFATNSDGTLQNIESGSIPIRASEVAEVFYASSRMGTGYAYQIKTLLSGSTATLVGMPNNDNWGSYHVKLNNGEIYRIKTEELAKHTYEPMYYRFTDENSAYGKYVQTKMILSLDGTNVSIEGRFGCNLPIGIEGLTYGNPTEVRFVAEDGTTYSSPIIVNPQGNLEFNLSGISLKAEEWGNYLVRGNLYVVEDGSLYEFRFTGDETSFEWDIDSEISGLYMYYNNEPEIDALEIGYWP